MPQKAMRDIFDQVKAQVEAEWGKAAFGMLGTRVRRALLAEGILSLASTQGFWTSPETVRRIVDEGYQWAVEEAGI